MAKTVDVLRYVLGLDAKPFRREARRVDKDVRKLKSGVDKTAKSFGGLKTAVVGAAAAFAAMKLAGLIKDATLVAARIEVLNNVFELTGKAAGKTNAELEFTKQKLIALGIAEKEALQIGLRFIQVQLDLADSLKIARAAQDLAVVAGTDSSTTALALTNAIVKQRPILLKQFGIVANLDEIFGKMAKTLGKNVNQLTENERRTAFLNTILEKAKTVAGSYEKAMELVGKRLTSLPRHFQNAQKAVGQHFLPAMRVAVDGAAEFLKIITEGFQTAEQDFTKSLFKFGEGFAKFVKVAPQIKALRKEFEELTAISKRTEPQQTKLNKVIKALGDILPETRVVLRGYNDDLEGTRLALDKVIERNEELQRLELLDVLEKQAEAFRLNQERLEALQRTGSGGVGFVALNIEADTERVKKFTASLTKLTEEREALQTRIDNITRDGGKGNKALEKQLESLEEKIALTTEALFNATRSVIGYEAEVARLNAANDAQIANWSQLFPNIKDNALAMRLMSFAAKELLADILALQAAQKESLRLAKENADLGPFDQPPIPLGLLLSKFTTSDEDVLAAGVRDALVNGIKRNPDTFSAAARLLAAGLSFEIGDFGITQEDIGRADQLARFRRQHLSDNKKFARDRAKKATDEKQSAARQGKTQKLIQGFLDRQERERAESANKITKSLDVLSDGLFFIDQQMASLVTRAADFVEALATGDIFAKIGAGIGLVGTLIGAVESLFGTGGNKFVLGKTEEQERLARNQRELIEANKDVREAIDRWIATINEQSVGDVDSILLLFTKLQNLLSSIDPTDPAFDPEVGIQDFSKELLDILLPLFEEFDFEFPPEFLGNLVTLFESAGETGGLIERFQTLLRDLIFELGLPKEQLAAAIEADTLGQMLAVLEKLRANGDLTLERGQELIDFWKTFQDLTLEQEKELLQSLLDTLRASGDITPGSILDLLAALETLGEEIEREREAEETSGLTQIQRSVTTITEGQANIIAATLNSILGVLGLMDTKLAQIVTGLIGTEPGGLLGGVSAPLAATSGFGFELPEILASLLGIEDKLGSFLDRVATQLGPTVTVQAGGVIINQNFPGITDRKEVEDVTATAITEALITDGRARGIKV